MIFLHPEPPLKKHRILPVFIPFAGCPQRCIFCAQDKQTGLAVAPSHHALAQLETALEERAKNNAVPVEIAFYGGTFTALAQDLQLALLDLCSVWRKRGMVTAVRCSTRPDCIESAWVQILQNRGLDLIELGVQSFNAHALQISKRGYLAETVYHATACLHSLGMPFGIQLLPGMPSVDTRQFLSDMHEALSLHPVCMRLYPCLVLEGTKLAAWWQEGRYTPWTLEEAVPTLAQALMMTWEAGVPVIRIGLTHDKALEQALLAGPAHPALGSMVKAKALHSYIAQKIQSFPKHDSHHFSLAVPRRWQGLFWGHANNLVNDYARLGIRQEHVHWCHDTHFTLEQC